jgi:hypothetical protein
MSKLKKGADDIKKGTEYAGHEVKQGTEELKKGAKSAFNKIKKPF